MNKQSWICSPGYNPTANHGRDARCLEAESVLVKQSVEVPSRLMDYGAIPVLLRHPAVASRRRTLSSTEKLFPNPIGSPRCTTFIRSILILRGEEGPCAIYFKKSTCSQLKCQLQSKKKICEKETNIPLHLILFLLFHQHTFLFFWVTVYFLRGF